MIWFSCFFHLIPKSFIEA